jgi:hypothetical protein
MQFNRTTCSTRQANAGHPLVNPFWLPVATGILLAACTGCSNGRYPISGEVTFDSTPVQSGVITMEPADGNGPVVGGKIVGGRYNLTGNAAPFPGKKLVRISASRKTGRRIPVGPPAPPGVMTDEVDRYIPKIYNTQSQLTCDVSADGSRQIDFILSIPR